MYGWWLYWLVTVHLLCQTHTLTYSAFFYDCCVSNGNLRKFLRRRVIDKIYRLREISCQQIFPKFVRRCAVYNFKNTVTYSWPSIVITFADVYPKFKKFFAIVEIEIIKIID